MRKKKTKPLVVAVRRQNRKAGYNSENKKGRMTEIPKK